MNNSNIRVIAYYLPQFHPIKENDEWWGKGFTEWTNVGKAKKLFKDHYQPRVPADLGYYDLRMAEAREAQASLAKLSGIEGFCYWHYWFAGRRLLEKPFNEVLKSKQPSLPFSLAWANETWSGIWNNNPKRILLEQTYPGIDDYKNHFLDTLPAFQDNRYIKINGKLLFVIYKPFNLPNPKLLFDTWNNLAIQNGLDGFYFVGVSSKPDIETNLILEMGFDAVNSYRINEAQSSLSEIQKKYYAISRKLFSGNIGLTKYDYSEIMKNWIKPDDFKENIIPSLVPNWDNSPRSGKNAIILHNSTPELFENHLEEVINTVSKKENKLIFLKSWNEWAEGNYVEPDLKFGLGYINKLKKHLVG